jgi:hypothetical protein
MSQAVSFLKNFQPHFKCSFTSSVTIDGVWIGNRILQVIIGLSLIHTLYNSPHPAFCLFSLLYLHRLAPVNGSQCRRSLSSRVPRLRSSLAGAYLTTTLHGRNPWLLCAASVHQWLVLAASRLPVSELN